MDVHFMYYIIAVVNIGSKIRIRDKEKGVCIRYVIVTKNFQFTNVGKKNTYIIF